jgi:hypothetical protein
MDNWLFYSKAQQAISELKRGTPTRDSSKGRNTQVKLEKIASVEHKNRVQKLMQTTSSISGAAQLDFNKKVNPDQPQISKS